MRLAGCQKSKHCLTCSLIFDTGCKRVSILTHTHTHAHTHARTHARTNKQTNKQTNKKTKNLTHNNNNNSNNNNNNNQPKNKTKQQQQQKSKLKLKQRRLLEIKPFFQHDLPAVSDERHRARTPVLGPGLRAADPGPLLQSRVHHVPCLLYTSPSPRDWSASRMPSSA